MMSRHRAAKACDPVARVVPSYISQVLPAVMLGGAALVVAHGNSLRALMLALEGLHLTPSHRSNWAPAKSAFYALHADTTIEALHVNAA